jgi:predicted pyridoxine 5'-phosphate oxidase superfamily flavin-nucleotide-binding protein
MLHRYLEITGTPSVKAAQAANGSRATYARFEAGEVVNNRLSDEEAEFIAARDSFYMATTSETGWPYLQHRGGPAGFLRVLDETTLGFADFGGNRQYISLGNVSVNDRVALFLMDYPNRRRLKIMGHVAPRALAADPDLAARLAVPGYKAKLERALVIQVEAFDWNCPQHITPRFTGAEMDAFSAPMQARLIQLEAENERLRERLEQSISSQEQAP